MRSSASNTPMPVAREARVKRTIIFDLDDTLITGKQTVLPGMMRMLCSLAADPSTACAIVTHGTRCSRDSEKPAMYRYGYLHAFRKAFSECFAGMFPDQGIPELFYAETYDLVHTLATNGHVAKPYDIAELGRDQTLGCGVMFSQFAPNTASLLRQYGKGALRADRQNREHLLFMDILKQRGVSFDVDDIIIIGDQRSDVGFAKDIESDLRQQDKQTNVHKILFQHPELRKEQSDVVKADEVWRFVQLKWAEAMRYQDVAELKQALDQIGLQQTVEEQPSKWQRLVSTARSTASGAASWVGSVIFPDIEEPSLEEFRLDDASWVGRVSYSDFPISSPFSGFPVSPLMAEQWRDREDWRNRYTYYNGLPDTWSL